MASAIVNISGCAAYEVARATGIARGDGAFLYDTDGKRYIDLCNGFGSILLGHADPDVTAAVIEAVASGVPAAANLGRHEEISARFAADLGFEVGVALFKTGTATARSAVCAAQRASGRRIVASAGYHGYDAMWDPGPLLTPNSSGVIDFYYVPQFLDRIIADHFDQLAAVIIAPDYVHIDASVTADLFARCREHGIITIADDVKYGYRLRNGTSLGLGGAAADVYLYSKGIANGWPVSCAVGDPAIMAELSLATSTLTHDLPSLAAAAATLRKGRELDVPAAIAVQGARFVDGARGLLAGHDLPIEIVGGGSAFQFVAPPPVEGLLLAEAVRAGLILESGDQQFPSFCFSDAVVDQALEHLDLALGALAAHHPELVGQQVTTSDRLASAWLQMDGVAASYTEDMSCAAIADWVRARLGQAAADQAAAG